MGPLFLLSYGIPGDPKLLINFGTLGGGLGWRHWNSASGLALFEGAKPLAPFKGAKPLKRVAIFKPEFVWPLPGVPWRGPLGSPGIPWGPLGSHGIPWGPQGGESRPGAFPKFGSKISKNVQEQIENYLGYPGVAQGSPGSPGAPLLGFPGVALRSPWVSLE